MTDELLSKQRCASHGTPGEASGWIRVRCGLTGSRGVTVQVAAEESSRRKGASCQSRLLPLRRRLRRGH